MKKHSIAEVVPQKNAAQLLHEIQESILRKSVGLPQVFQVSGLPRLLLSFFLIVDTCNTTCWICWWFEALQQKTSVTGDSHSQKNLKSKLKRLPVWDLFEFITINGDLSWRCCLPRLTSQTSCHLRTPTYCCGKTSPPY